MNSLKEDIRVGTLQSNNELIPQMVRLYNRGFDLLSVRESTRQFLIRRFG